MKLWLAVPMILLATGSVSAQDIESAPSEAGYVPVLSGGFGYVHNVYGGVPTLEPQINPILLLPLGSHVLFESRVDFTGFFRREHGTSGPFKGRVFQSVAFVQLDWLASKYVTVTAGKYLVPFGLYNERLDPIWIRNLQDPPITAGVGTGASGAGDGVMLRGAPVQNHSFKLQYSASFSALSNIRKLEASRAAGGDASIYFTNYRLEVGASYQRLLQPPEINSTAAYFSWQPPDTPLNVKFEYDRSHNGQGYWLEPALWFRDASIVPIVFKHLQFVARMQQVEPLNGGRNGLPSVNTNRFDAGLNYYFRDDLRLVSSYGRQFSSSANTNIWNIGFTYRFIFPLWPGSSK